MSSLKSAKPVPDGGPAYDEDFVGWTEHQAALIRKYGASGALPGIDLDTLVEEIEGLGLSALNSVISLIELIFVHAIKLRSAPEALAANHWRDEILLFRSQFDRSYQRSMARRIDLDRVWQRAVAIAGSSLRAHGQVLAPDLSASCPLGLEDLRFGTDPDALAARLGS